MSSKHCCLLRREPGLSPDAIGRHQLTVKTASGAEIHDEGPSPLTFSVLRLTTATAPKKISAGSWAERTVEG